MHTFRNRVHHCEKQQVVATGGTQMHQKGSASVTCDVFCSQDRRGLLGPENALLQKAVVSCDPIIVHIMAPLPESAGNKMPFNACAVNSNIFSPFFSIGSNTSCFSFSLKGNLFHSPPHPSLITRMLNTSC